MWQLNNKIAVIFSATSCVIVAATLAGCGPESSAAVRAKAEQYRRKGEVSAALITLKNAVSSNPADRESRYVLAEVYIDSGDPVSAEKEIRMALGLGIAPRAAAPVLGHALLLQGQFAQVLDATGQATAGTGADVLCLRADAYLALGRNDEAQQLYDKVLHTEPRYAAALIGLGRLAYLRHDVEAARRYAEQAIAAEPRNTDALMYRGDLLRAQNQPDQAIAAYDRVLALNPSHRSARVEKAKVEVAMARYEAAQADLDLARQVNPGSVLVAYTQALLYFTQGKNAAAQESIQKVLRVAPDHMPTILLAGAVSLNLGWLYQAENHLRRYLEAYPDNRYVRKLLASALLRNGHAADAQQVLAPALKESRQDVQLLALAGDSSMQAREFSKAVDYFQEASALEPKAANLRTALALGKLRNGEREQAVGDLQLAIELDAHSPDAGVMLVKTELGLGHLEQAYSAVLALERAQPDSAAVQDLKGIVYVGKRDLVQARASFTKALALQASYFPAADDLAQLDVREQQGAAARQDLRRFLDKNPGSIEAMTALASLAASEGKDADATQWLERASALDPGAIAPAVNLIAQYLRSGQIPRALNMSRKLQVTHPDNPDLLDLLGKSQLANGDQDDALATYKQLAVALPRSAQAQMQVAALELMFKNTSAAEEYLKAAVAMQPDFPAAQLALAELYVRKGWHQLALLEAEHLQRSYPNAAAGFQLEGDVLMGQNKAAQALPFYQKALALSATSELMIKTVHALRAAGKQEQAGRRLAQWLQTHPEDVRAQLFKAETLLADKQYGLAAAQLESIVKQHRDNVVALNNLALAYQLSQDARAQQAAEEAYRRASEQPVIMDTLGWILVDKGDTARGLRILRAANAKAPQARDIRYHLAVALYKAGDRGAARKELEALASGDMRFAQADDARALLQQLQ